VYKINNLNKATYTFPRNSPTRNLAKSNTVANISTEHDKNICSKTLPQSHSQVPIQSILQLKNQ